LSTPEPNPIVLFDGVCGVCNHSVQFLLKRDTHDRFRFASLQSEFSSRVLTRHGIDPNDLDTIYIVKNYDQADEVLLARSDAVLFIGNQLGGIWKLSGVGRLIPRTLRDAIYDIIARNRYRVLGKHESCMLPEPKHRQKFLDS
jgi:predicted DCC family thiol-disulfide oxidoreductase YuxK